jgi:hypothetical protein
MHGCGSGCLVHLRRPCLPGITYGDKPFGANACSSYVSVFLPADPARKRNCESVNHKAREKRRKAA